METKTKQSFRDKQTRLAEPNSLTLRTKKVITVGTICDVDINALGPNGVGMATLNRNISVFIPNTKIGE